MDLLDHRPHFRTTSTGHITTTTTTTTTTNELFICFTSRLSSSPSMKLTKSILSPGRAARDGAAAGPVSLSSSLSRRHRPNGSLKGGASPFLTANAGKRRGGGGGFENPEPSSPKVTCIGQVRVKTKKKVKQTRSLSRRGSGEISFRKAEQQPTADNNRGDKDRDRDTLSNQQAQIRYSNGGGAHYHQQPQQQHPQECSPHRNQRWVHLPIISCLLPCKSSCFSRNKDDENKQNGSDKNLCGSVSGRWFVSVNDGEGGKSREIELVVGGGDEEEETPAGRISMRRSSRRHVFDDIEVKDDRIEINGQSLEVGEEEKARISICIPPKNALLLMRCRSDPMKMASLGSRFSWDAQGVRRNDSEKIKEFSEEQEEEVKGCEGKCEVFEKDATVLVENNEQEGGISDEADQENLEPVEDGDGELGQVEEMVVENETEELQQETITEITGEKLEEEEDEEVESNMSSFEALLNQENAEDYENSPIQDEDDREVKVGPSTESDTEINAIQPVLEEEEEALMEKENEEEEEESNTIAEKDPTFVDDGIEQHRVTEAQGKSDPETTQQENEEESSEIGNGENQEISTGNIIDDEPKKEKESTMLPDCLLLMMCEPKLSMEVSKETWVCSTDFIRWLPERPTKALKAAVVDQERVQRRPSTDSKPNKPPVRNNNDHQQQQQQQRSSCSLPAAAAAASMATMIEQKLTNAAAYEPFVLTRCKSEPMRTAATKLMPESCFWKNAVSKMEPHHRRAAVGVGAAGVGF
ncbi:hypothetical protein OROHE_012814 [Orobanche hederae]